MVAYGRVCRVVATVVGVLLGVATLLILVAIIRAATLEEMDYQEYGVDPGVREELPEAYLATLPELMARALSIPTVSLDRGDYDTEEMLRFHQFLRDSFPDVFNKSYIKVEVVNTYSLLFTVTGGSPELKPYLLMGHIDVVPVDEDKWTHDPWGGLILPDPVTGTKYIWGRGAIDNKLGVMGIIMALQYLAKSDFQPARSFFVAFGHDEEVRGRDGAGHIARLLQGRGVQLDFVLDEGMPVLDKVIPGIPVPTAMIGVTEKGYLTLKMEVEGEGGHSSMPPRDAAVTRLASAVYNLGHYRHPSMFGRGPAFDLFTYLAPKASWPHKMIYANLWLFKPLMEAIMSRKRDSDATIRTTTSVTIVRAGVKENVVPVSASAIINHRIHPAQSLEEVIDYDHHIINDPSVKLTVQDYLEAHPVSPYGPEVAGWRLITAAIHHHFPSAITAPGLLVGNTDTRYYLNMTSDIYRFVPLLMTAQDLVTIHGHDERISEASIGVAASFYYHLILSANREVPPLHTQPGHRSGEL
nr:N-fatty-acyl-amino acid synthase/hydrolase PM20D1-like isoform X1 [Procambarus clarkii]XP_045622749.1 N-fatty-acyl-amino acid synthase/hydrolase PM20D1-like isoform X1 [Procambarus clarkii]XP_045622750.1 N-fatty-acyl-amino acid synthase/hydrolase PM20D1-like isoform X1 [Procambarus clarkii]XP_045622751.1 N-fatty-acyl-amino acid synthase/hydrolase PM20D1-like isoform X1 [Procambarus clarkii]XP_045622752.1 N-fatty-acyl-amino acid synthase/hydrolase PM20D1-like isoform X1 [Procambarus clarkii]